MSPQPSTSCRAVRSLVLAGAVVAFLALASDLFAGPPISFINGDDFRLSRFGDTEGRLMAVPARGPSGVRGAFGRVGGVLFQGTAKPANPIKGPIKLSFKPKGKHDASLQVEFDGMQGSSEVPAWVWVVAARFAANGNTAAISLYGNPETKADVDYLRANPDGFLVNYHPELANTLVGFMLFLSDTMFVQGNPNLMRKATTKLQDFDKYSGYHQKFNEPKSAAAAKQLAAAINVGDWQTYMLNDVATDYTFAVAGGALKLTGVPDYQFAKFDKKLEIKNGKLTNNDPKDKTTKVACKTHKFMMEAGEAYKIRMVSSEVDAFLRLEDKDGKQLAENDDENKSTFNARIDFVCNATAEYHIIATCYPKPVDPKLATVGKYQLTVEQMVAVNNASKAIRDNRNLLYDLNPQLYAVVDDFAQMVAFFNYVKAQNPAGFKAFVNQLGDVMKIIPEMKTPAGWVPKAVKSTLSGSHARPLVHWAGSEVTRRYSEVSGLSY